MNVVILYDRLDLALKTNAVLARAATRADEASSLKVKPWRVDLILHPLTADRATSDAAEAHLLILAISVEKEVSPSLLRWLDLWAAHREVRDAALAISDGQEDNALSSHATPELSRLAARHGLSFIFGNLCPADNETAWENSGQSEFAERSALQAASSVPINAYSRGWGIND